MEVDMDVHTFDQWTVSLTCPRSRRKALRLLAGSLTAGLFVRDGVRPTDAQRLDSDGDGLYDDDESFVYGTDPFGYDSDGDGVGDGEEVYYGTNPAIGEQVVLQEPPPDASVGEVGNGGAVAIGDVNNGGNAGDAIGVGDTWGSCHAEGATCTYDTDCCNTGTVLCCFDGTTLNTRCTDVTVYGGHCL
jgi:hypothetical protein